MMQYAFRLFFLSFFLLVPIIGFSVSEQSSITKRPHIFTNAKAANDFINKMQAQGGRASLTVQKQDKIRYSALLKSYRQWSDAVKQLQLLEKRGFSGLQISKGRYERGYSIIVLQSLNKQKVGQAFNRLRTLGFKNAKVHTEKVQLIRYVVMVHEVKKGLPASKKPELARTDTRMKPILPGEKEKPEAETIVIMDDQELKKDEMIFVLSDSSDITDELFSENITESVSDDHEWGIDKIQVEAELFTRSASPVDHVEYVHASGHSRWRLSNQWELQLAARLDGNYQHGKDYVDSDELDPDYGNNFLRFRNDKLRITLGSDTVRWGKVDNFAPTDNMSTLDLSRGVLYKWGEGYRSSPILRSEIFLQWGKLDLVYLPYFREAELPDKENVWYPVNANDGTILGFGNNPLLGSLLKNGRINDNINDTDGGFGVRLSSKYEQLDYDIVIQKVKLSSPYYRLNPAILADPSTASQQKYILEEMHPRTWVIGADVALQAADVLLRLEGAWFSDLPATTKNFVYETYHGFKWAGGIELYPGDGNVRLNLQLSGTHIDEEEKIVDRDNMVSLGGEIESLFANNRWKFSSQFNLGLDEEDVYIATELAYLGWEPFEFYSAVHYLEGDDNTLGGFYKENSMVAFGWRGKY